ncbi:alpha/beta fold hydrolase [Streptomyces sp. MJM1172]|uniref:alpha/beta fold hydrolase n=1 Tax=Streptomyces sp. MJM1172 TaxID=1703926 RepID=UPI00093E7EB1|nr:alpha/beta hydrolase [Streptomyces sp. MJM1172]OKI61590.1 hydrolase [Streptomyces sp. MJM1172]
MSTVQSSDGTNIAFDRSGEGAPLILVGGAFSERAHPVMAQLAEQMAPHFTVYNYDRRGRGDSGDVETYDIEREIDDLEALIAEAGGSVRIFGMSSGGNLAFAAAARGLDITRIAAYDPPFMVDESRPRPPADFAEQLAALAAEDRRGDAVELFMVTGMGVPAEIVAQMRPAPFWQGLESLAHTLAYDSVLMGDFTLPTERLRAISVPVLVMDGEKTAPWLRTAARTAAETLPAGQHRSLPDQDAAVDPAVLAIELKNFLVA